MIARESIWSNQQEPHTLNVLGRSWPRTLPLAHKRRIAIWIFFVGVGAVLLSSFTQPSLDPSRIQRETLVAYSFAREGQNLALLAMNGQLSSGELKQRCAALEARLSESVEVLRASAGQAEDERKRALRTAIQVKFQIHQLPLIADAPAFLRAYWAFGSIAQPYAPVSNNLTLNEI